MASQGSAPIVRIARADDVPVLARLRARWDGVESGAAFETRLAAWWEHEGDRRTVWLVELDGSAVGMASILEYRRMPWPNRPDVAWGYVANMFVRSEHRGRGIGSALLRELIRAAEQRGYARLVVRPSAEALPLYTGAGFAPADGAGGELLLVRSAPALA